MNQQSIRQDIERYQRALTNVYGAGYSSKTHVRHVAGDTVSIRFPKGGKVLIERERLHILTQYLNAQAALEKTA